MRLVVSALLGLHGLIHLMGFLKPWGLAAVPQLSGRTIVPLSDAVFRGVGLLGLVTSLACLSAALLQWLDREWWWMLAAPALVLSQMLIALQWHDACTGTILNERRAPATLAFKDITVSAAFEFDARGRLTSMTAQRYYGGTSLETWMIPITEWKTIRGIEMPVRGGAVWKLAAGDFDYYQWEIVDVETNRTTL